MKENTKTKKRLMSYLLNNMALVFLLVSFGLSASAACPSISDKLDITLVSDIGASQLSDWEEDSDCSAIQSLSSFWRSLTNESLSVEEIVDGVFAATSTDGGLSALYIAKVKIFRHYRKKSNSQHLQNIETEWLNRYTDLAISQLENSGISEYGQMVKNFRNKVRSREISLADLSPVLREQVTREIPDTHHGFVNGKDEKTGFYFVTGYYNAGTQRFTIDLARPIGDTLVTFAHELVHAADPQLEAHKVAFRDSYKQVINILSRLFADKESPTSLAKAWAETLVEHVLFEAGYDETGAMAEVMGDFDNQKEILERQGAIGESELNEGDKRVIQRFLSAVVGLTLKNEYRAYGFSIALYVRLKDQLKLIPPSERAEKHLKEFLRGDHLFSVNLFYERDINPYSRIKSRFSKEIRDRLRRAHEAQNDELAKALIADATRLQKALNRLEIMYIETVEDFVNETEVDPFFQSTIASFRQISTTKEYLQSRRSLSVLPEYARPGGFDSPANPYTILTARMSTAWVLRFKETIKVAASRFIEMNPSLINLYLGVIDSSNLSVEEQKLAGIRFEKSLHESFEDPCGAPDKPSLPDSIQALFPKIDGSLDLIKSPSVSADGYILPGAQIMKNLLRLKLVTTLVWIKESFPTYHSTITASMTFLRKLRTGNYDSQRITKERAEELQSEVLAALENSKSTRTEVDMSEVLFDHLSLVYEIAQDERGYNDEWAQLANETLESLRNFGDVMETLRVYRQKSRDDIKNSLQEVQESFNKQISGVVKACRSESSSPGLINFSRETPAIQLLPHYPAFHLQAVCMEKTLYLVRRHTSCSSGSSRGKMTTLTDQKNGQFFPYSFIFQGARPVALIPYTPKSSGKKKSRRRRGDRD